VTTPLVISDSTHLREVVTKWRKEGMTVAFVPTMGSLHAGHKALAVRARDIADRVVLSIFVNPLQFGVGEDFERYPRDLDLDVQAVSGGLVDVVFAPTVGDVYPAGEDSVTRLTAGPVGDVFEGATRPGHFDGVVTVVNRLCEMAQPDVVVFGDKDAQQVFLVKDMVTALNLPWRVEEVDTVRDPDGVALSSRNQYLSREERVAARALPEALTRAASASNVVDALAVADEELKSEPLVSVDYVALVDPKTFLEVSQGFAGGLVRMIIAARVGHTRLIDTKVFSIPQ
jgi:pantoate--beta-alanine ligase